MIDKKFPLSSIPFGCRLGLGQVQRLCLPDSGGGFGGSGEKASAEANGPPKMTGILLYLLRDNVILGSDLSVIPVQDLGQGADSQGPQEHLSGFVAKDDIPGIPNLVHVGDLPLHTE